LGLVELRRGGDAHLNLVAGIEAVGRLVVRPVCIRDIGELLFHRPLGLRRALGGGAAGRASRGEGRHQQQSTGEKAAFGHAR
jgi:hypothetical protein